MIEHGIGECLFGDGADFSGDSEAEFMDGLEGLIVEDGFFCARDFEVMCDIEFGFVGTEGGHVVSHSDALVEGFHDGKLHGPSEIGVSREDQDEGVIGVHLEVGEESEFFEGSGLKQLGLIDCEEDGFPHLFFGLQDSALNLVVDGTL